MFDADLLDKWGMPRTATWPWPTASRHHYRLYKEDNRYVAEIEAPGFTKSDFSIEWESGKLRVSGERKVKEPEGREYFANNPSTGEVDLSITGMDDDVDKAATHASYEAGILYVVMPIKKDARRKVEVK